MTPQERIKRYVQIATALTILVWGMLCFFLLVSPRLNKLRRVDRDLTEANKQRADMKKEIEDAAIVGAPAAGESRYEKFHILGADEEQLFLSDLIAFCKETNNTLNVVRRADIGRSAITKEGQEEKRPAGASSAQKQVAAGDATTPKPTIVRVPHTVNYSGTFLSSFHLLRKLESYKRLLTVERVEIATDSRMGYPRVNGNITIDLYLVKNPGAPPPTAEQEGEVESPPAEEEAGEAEAETGDQG